MPGMAASDCLEVGDLGSYVRQCTDRHARQADNLRQVALAGALHATCWPAELPSPGHGHHMTIRSERGTLDRAG
jgi:hypothetical protein